MCQETKGIKGIFCKFLFDKDSVEIERASLMFLIGIWLWFNDTFQVSAVYKIMASIGTEKQWSMIFVGIAITQALAVAYTDFRFTRYGITFINAAWIRKHILLVKGAVWFTLFIGVMSGDARALSAPMFFFFSFNAFRCFFCIKCLSEKS